MTERMPQGVVYTTFHFPGSALNTVTTEFSDWATNCPEYKVTAVEVMPQWSRTGEGVAGQREPHHGDSALAVSVVRMANQLAANFSHLDGEEAARMVGNHSQSFWSVAMRTTLREQIEAERGSFDPVVIAACLSGCCA